MVASEKSPEPPRLSPVPGLGGQTRALLLAGGGSGISEGGWLVSVQTLRSLGRVQSAASLGPQEPTSDLYSSLRTYAGGFSFFSPSEQGYPELFTEFELIYLPSTSHLASLWSQCPWGQRFPGVRVDSVRAHLPSELTSPQVGGGPELSHARCLPEVPAGICIDALFLLPLPRFLSWQILAPTHRLALCWEWTLCFYGKKLEGQYFVKTGKVREIQMLVSEITFYERGHEPRPSQAGCPGKRKGSAWELGHRPCDPQNQKRLLFGPFRRMCVASGWRQRPALRVHVPLAQPLVSVVTVRESAEVTPLPLSYCSPHPVLFHLLSDPHSVFSAWRISLSSITAQFCLK